MALQPDEFASKIIASKFSFRVSRVMSQTLVLGDDVYKKLSREAARQGVSAEALVAYMTNAVSPRTTADERDLFRGTRIELLFDKFRDGPLTVRERAELERLIDEEYEVATRRADRLIAEKTAGKKRPTTKRRSQRVRS